MGIILVDLDSLQLMDLIPLLMVMVADCCQMRYLVLMVLTKELVIILFLVQAVTPWLPTLGVLIITTVLNTC
ncbi:hypothetical protein D3C85_1687570 [compost metagenome]